MSTGSSHSGLLVSLLQKYLSMFQIVFLGSVLVWINPMICAFAPNMIFITVFLGGFQGVGMGFVECIVSVAISTCFQKRRGIAMGIKDVGCTLSALVFPKILSLLTAEYTLRGALGICGALCMNVTALVLILRRNPFTIRHRDSSRKAPAEKPSPQTEELLNSSAEKCTQSERAEIVTKNSSGNELQNTVFFSCGGNDSAPTVQTLKVGNQASQSGKEAVFVLEHDGSSKCDLQTIHKENGSKLQKRWWRPRFYAVVFQFVIIQYVAVVMRSVNVDYALDKGSELSQAELTVTYCAATDIAGRTAVMMLADCAGLSRTFVACVAMFCYSALTIALRYATGFGSFLALYMCLSMTHASLMTLMLVLVADHFGSNRIAFVWGVSGLLSTPLLLATPSITGFFRDTLGSYDHLMLFAGGLTGCAGLSALWLWMSGRKKA
ncbi:monocarboxylate transporter 12-like isoform X2 [Haemaphysalis longicornis]